MFAAESDKTVVRVLSVYRNKEKLYGCVLGEVAFLFALCTFFFLIIFFYFPAYNFVLFWKEFCTMKKLFSK